MRTILALLLCVGDGLSPAEFERLHKELRAPDGEAWRGVPWRVNLLDAQADAARLKKPIFMWSMDGHPMGCT